MPSFRIGVTPHRRAAARFVENVKRSLQQAYADRHDISQSAIADHLGVNRSVISRQLRGDKDMSLARVGELSWCLGYEPRLILDPIQAAPGANHQAPLTLAPSFQTKASVASTDTEYTPGKSLELSL